MLQNKYSKLRFYWSKRYGNWVWFGVVFLLFLIHLLTSRYHDLYYDSSGYWFLANTFDQKGASRFSFYNFNSALRGYLLPLLHYPAAVIVREFFPDAVSEAAKSMGALWAGSVFGVVGPVVWEKVSGKAISNLRRLLFAGVGFVLWRDYFNFPLSDFPSVLALLLALLVAYRSQNYQSALATGAFVAAAVYIRPLSLLVVPFVAGLLLLGPSGQDSTAGIKISWLKQAVRLGLFSLAFLLVGIPQYVINSNNYQSPDLLILGLGDGDFRINEVDNVYLFKINEGLDKQRYETNIGTDYPIPQAIYLDAAGRALLERNGNPVFDSYYKYLVFVVSHPADMAALYTRHFFNGLDVLYPGPYVSKIYGSTLPLSLVNYTVLFAALLVILLRVRQLQASHWLLVGALFITCLASMPLMIETRYFLPLNLLLYAVACFGWPTEWQWRMVPRKHVVSVALAYCFFLAICLTLSGNTQASLSLKPKTLQP
ncbi:hypothetical protein SAMN00120144_2653 [Hymenobacter roseosalivarius DSM 11622]|uniref:Glycosyltransferase RgtA/B/C/D-like domain-containing protein n=1 Tax=Hymenobacter roseosalivarius DSM 11622 TaxID=645990 RepID=A0A1W1VJM0_9BACT|nr:hypothetical protein [Hymenobacter roseosalivarius]SMB93528.1 hypothetical protein SAMN00120144_2653 [Hymenobacter roseosalivarius DSM 11622]